MFYAHSNCNTCPIKNLFIISSILVFSVFSIQFTTTNIDLKSIHYCSASNKKKILFNTKRKTFEGVLLSINLSNQTIKYSLRNLYGVGSKPVHAVATATDKITVVSLTAVAWSVYLNLCIDSAFLDPNYWYFSVAKNFLFPNRFAPMWSQSIKKL